MVDDEQNKRFQEVFGFDPSRKVSDSLMWIRRGVIIAKLQEMVHEVPALQKALDDIFRKYRSGVQFSLAEAQRDLQVAEELDEKLQRAKTNFLSSLELARSYTFDLPDQMEVFLPKEDTKAGR